MNELPSISGQKLYLTTQPSKALSVSLVDNFFNKVLSSVPKTATSDVTLRTTNISVSEYDAHIEIADRDQLKNILSEIRESGKAPSPPPPAQSSIQEEVDRWFNEGLHTDSEKLFAITLSVFNEISYIELQEIYRIVLNFLQTDETGKEVNRSPFSFDDETWIQKFKAVLIKPINDSSEEIITYANELYPRAVFELLRRRYRTVLLDLLPVLKHVAERYNQKEIITRVAHAIAEIAKIAFHRAYAQVLEPWAGAEQIYMRDAASYSLTVLAGDDIHRLAVKDVLDNWSSPKWNGRFEIWRYRWTAASTYRQLGFIETSWADSWVFSGLERLAGFDDVRIADSVIHALTVLSIHKPVIDVLKLLGRWVSDSTAQKTPDLESQARCIIAVLAFMTIAEIHQEIIDKDTNETSLQAENLLDIVNQNKADENDVWQLSVAVGVQALEYGIGDAFFDLIEQWSKQAAENVSLQNTVKNLIIEVFKQVGPLQKEFIFNRFNLWQLQPSDETLNRIASAAKRIIKEWGTRESGFSIIDSDSKLTGALNIILENDEALLSSLNLSPESFALYINPFLEAVVDIQTIIDALEGKKPTEVRIRAIQQNSPISVSVEGVTKAVEVVQETVVQWKRKHAQTMAQLLEQEKLAAIEKTRAEVLESRARAAKERAEKDRLLAEAATQRVDAERKELENEIIRLKLQKAKIQMALEVLNQINPNLTEEDKFDYLMRILPPLDTIIASPLRISKITHEDKQITTKKIRHITILVEQNGVRIPIEEVSATVTSQELLSNVAIKIDLPEVIDGALIRKLTRQKLMASQSLADADIRDGETLIVTLEKQ